MREFILSYIIPKDRRTLEKWLVWLELVSIAGGILLIALILLMAFQYDVATVLKLGVLALLDFIGLSTITLLQALLLIEWNTRKK